MYSIHDLAAFVAVADGGSVRQAGVELSRTQPAITQAIQRLEEVVGFPLLDRSGYRASLTERGELFLKRARVIVQQAQGLKSYAGVLSGGSESVVRLAVHGSLSPTYWIHLVEHLPQAFKDTVVEIHTEEGEAPLKKLIAGDVDLAIAAGPPTDKYVMDMDRQILGDIEFVLVMKADRFTSNLEEDLKKIPQIITTDFDEPATNYGIAEGNPYWHVNDHKTKVELIAAGLGWGAVPKWLAENLIEREILRPFHYRGVRLKISHTYYLCHCHEWSLGPVARSIWESVNNRQSAG